MDDLRPGVGPERCTDGDRDGSASARVPGPRRPHHPGRRLAGRAVRLLIGATLLATGWIVITSVSSQAAETHHGRTLGGLTRVAGPVSAPVRQVLGVAGAATAGRSQHSAGRHAPSRAGLRPAQPEQPAGTAQTAPLVALVHTGTSLVGRGTALVGDGTALVTTTTSSLLGHPVQRVLPGLLSPLALVPSPVAGPLTTAVLPLTPPSLAAVAPSAPVESPAAATVRADGGGAAQATAAVRHLLRAVPWPGRPGPVPAPDPSGPAASAAGAAGAAAGVALGLLGLGGRGRGRRTALADHRLPISIAPRPGIRPA